MIGTSIGPYRVTAELGSGGMGAVWLATVEGDAPGAERGARVAVKVIHPHLLATPGFFKRFLREADIGKSVRHENVVRTIDVDATLADGKQVNYIVMEYVEGRTLRVLLREMKTVPEALLRELAGQIAAGLAAIHEKGIVHRDLKPENVLVTKEHQVRIMDLGVARLQEATVAITKEGQFAGSLLYAAPEQFGFRSAAGAKEDVLRGGEGSARGAKEDGVDHRTDLYSLGVMLYELATGSNPFERDSAAQVIAAHLNETPRRVRELNTEVSAFLSELTASLLAKAAAERVGSATELRDVLKAGEGSPWWAAREKSVREREKRLPPIQVRRETELHGRETEMALLADAWTRAQQGRGNVVFLEGEAGIGKTRLVDAFLRTLPPEAHVLYGAYSPTGGLGGLSDAITEKFGRANLADSLRPYLTVTPSLVPSFAALLLHEAPPSGSEPLRGEAIHAVFCHLLRALGAERPTVWVIDELHYAPEESRTIVLAMARAVEACRALVVVAARPGISEEETGHFARLEQVKRATLGRLSPRQVVQLLREAFKSEALAEKLGGKIGYKSDGVPYFVFEMIRGLKEGQFVRQLPDGTFVETQAVSDIEVPSAVRDLIEGRLRDLSEDDRGLLDVAAVMGFDFDPDLVARVREKKRVQVLEALAKIERRSGVVRAAGRGYRFDHHQIQEVLERQLSPVLREEYHAMLADAFVEREKLAGKDPKDVPGETALFLVAQGLGGSRPETAVPYLERALRHLADTYRWQECVDLADRALAAPGLLGGTDRVRALLAKANATSQLGRRDDTEAVAREAVTAADAAGDPLLRAKARGVLYSALAQSDLAAARTIAEEAVEFATASGDLPAQANALANLASNSTNSGRAAEGRRLGEIQLDLARRAGDRPAEASAHVGLAYTAVRLADLEAAHLHATRAVELARACNVRTIEATAHNNVGIVEYMRGRMDETLRRFETSAEISRATGQRMTECMARRNVAEMRLDVGDGGRARAYLAEAVALSRVCGNRRLQCWTQQVMAREAEEAGRTADAVRLYGESASSALELGEPTVAVDSSTLLARVALGSGDRDRARRALADALSAAGRMDNPVAGVLASCRLALVTGEGADAARARLLEAVPKMYHLGRMQAHFALWQAAHDPADLAAAHSILMHLREHAPPDCRESILTNVRLHREIVTAAKAAGL